MLITIDRFEGDYAVAELEDGTFADIPKQLFPNAKEGDIYSLERSGQAISERNKKIKRLTDKLFE